MRQIRQLDISDKRVELVVYPHPITIDSISPYHIRIPWMNYDSWQSSASPSLVHKLFWKCTCGISGTVGGIVEIYIDAKSGDVLYVYPLWNKRGHYERDSS